MKNLFTLLLFIFLNQHLFAQEICDNGIDDDGDQDIDLLDSDCICNSNVINDYILFEGFEDNTCCNTSFSCIDNDWPYYVTPNTPDYYNTCDSNLVNTFAPQPFPSENAVLGLGGSEFISRCLDNAFLAGQTYHLCFYAGYPMAFPAATPTFSIYGKPDCLDPPSSGLECPTDVGWTELGSFSASGNGGWELVSGTFTPSFDVKAILFSKSCQFVALGTFLDYHFIDLLKIDDEVIASCGINNAMVNLQGDCENGYSFEVSTIADPNDIVQFQWYLNGIAIANANSPTYSLIAQPAGDYQVGITFIDGSCFNSDPLTYQGHNPFTFIQATGDTIDCNSSNGGTIDLEVSGGNLPLSFLWSDGSTMQNPSSLSPGTYTVTVTDEQGCTTTSEATINGNFDFPEAVANASGAFDCNNLNEITIDGSGSSVGPNINYQWITTNGNIISGSNSITSLVNSAGNYSIIVTDTQNGCSSTDSIVVEDNTISEILFSLSHPECFGEMGEISIQSTIGGVAPLLYSIDGVNFSDNLNYTVEAGSYTLYVQDGIGCEFQTNAVVIEAQPVTVFTQPEVTIELGEAYTINAIPNIPSNQISSIEWFPVTGLSCSDCLNPLVEGLIENIEYSLTITTIDNCIANSSIKIQIIPTRKIYIPNAFSPNGDGWNDIFMIYSGQAEQVKVIHTLRIYNRWGEQIYQQDNFLPMDPNFSWDGKFKGNFLDPQVLVYYAEIEFIDGYKELYKGDLTLTK